MREIYKLERVTVYGYNPKKALYGKVFKALGLFFYKNDIVKTIFKIPYKILGKA